MNQYGICPVCQRFLMLDSKGRIAKRHVSVGGRRMKLSDVLGWCDGKGKPAMTREAYWKALNRRAGIPAEER